MSREIELKYRFITPMDADTLFNTPIILQYLETKPLLTQMLSIYYDTSYGLLKKYGGSLRLRRENAASVVTFKSARTSSRALSEKNEWEVSSDSIISAIPLLIKDGAPEDLLNTVLVSELSELARVSFSRYSAWLNITPKLTIELAHDTGVLINNGRNESFSELELELIRGEVSGLLAFGELLEKTLHIKPEQRSKLARALKV